MYSDLNKYDESRLSKSHHSERRSSKHTFFYKRYCCDCSRNPCSLGSLISFKNEPLFYCQISSDLLSYACVNLDFTLKLFLSSVFLSGVAYYRGPHLETLFIVESSPPWKKKPVLTSAKEVKWQQAPRLSLKALLAGATFEFFRPSFVKIYVTMKFYRRSQTV